MSIKTSKRIALGVIASLVIAPFAAIAPASATSAATTLPTVDGLTSRTVTVNVGTEVTTQLAATFAAAGAADVTYGLVATLTKPLGSAVTFADNQKVGATTDDIFTQGTIPNTIDTWTNAASGNVITVDSVGAITAGTVINMGVAKFTPDLPGKYVFRVSGSADSAAADSAADAELTVIALSAAASNTTTITATVVNPNTTTGVAGTDPSILIDRNSLGTAADGEILGQVISSPDSVDQPVGQLFGKVKVGGDSVAAGIVAGVTTTATNATRTTFAFEDETPELATGVYTFRFWVDSNSNGIYDAAEITVTASFTISAAVSANAGVSASISEAVRANSDNVRQFTVSVTLNDAAGRPTAGTVVVTEKAGTNLTNIAGQTLARQGTSNTYVGTFEVDANPASASVEVTVVATSGSFSDEATLDVVQLGALTSTVGQDAVYLTDVVGLGLVTDGVKESLATTRAVALAVTSDTAVTTHTYNFNAALGEEGKYLKIAVAPTASTSSAVVAPAFALIRIGEDLTASYSVTATTPTGANSTTGKAADAYTLTWSDSTGGAAATITFAAATDAWSVTPANFKAKFGDKVAVTGKLTDQFGRVLADKDVSVVVQGRNAGTYLGKTNAKGEFKFEWTDASTSTTVLTDALTFRYFRLATAASTSTTSRDSAVRTITYSATGPNVGSVVVTAPSLTETRAIDFAQSATGDPRAQSQVRYTVTVKDAAGVSVGSGVLVTFAGGADDMFVGNTSTVTGSLGTAFIDVYRQKAGSSAITATAGGVTSAAGPAVKWSNDLALTGNTAAAPVTNTARVNARYVSLKSDMATSVPEGIVRFIATVTDRFGNPVSGAEVTFSENGVGRFKTYTGTAITTNAFGEASVDMETTKLETGTMSVSVLLSDALASQKDDIAGVVRVRATSATPAASGLVVGDLSATVLNAISGVTAAVKSATATATVANPPAPEVVVPQVAPTLKGSLNGRVLLFGSCMADEGDMIIYVKRPGGAWNEKAKTLECVAGEFDGSLRAPKNYPKYYRVKQEGTGLWSSSVLIRP